MDTRSRILLLLALLVFPVDALTARDLSPAADVANEKLLSESPQNPPVSFLLSHPTDGASNQNLELDMSWTTAAGATKYEFQLSEDRIFASPLVNRATGLTTTDVAPAVAAANQSFKIDKTNYKLEPGKRYFWRVYAVMGDGSKIEAGNGPPWKFVTTGNFLSGLSQRGFKLQKALSGPDKGELAEFSFIDTIGQKTVYSTTFALSWQPDHQPSFGGSAFSPQISVEGSLASDESESEDAWRLRVGGVLSTNFIKCRPSESQCNELSQPLITGLYTKFSAKYEGDRDFDVKKLSAEFSTTPSSFKLAMGTARPISPSKSVQFQWRPFFGVDVGHTFRKGSSEERESTILRFVPRARAVINLQFLRRALNMDDVNIFADDTFYYLPLENDRKRNNFFRSGIQFNFTSNFGVELTYKTGRSAPKFEKINTLQAVLGFRF